MRGRGGAMPQPPNAGGPVSAAAAVAAPFGVAASPTASGADDGALGVERLLAELHEYQNSTVRECAEFRNERSQLSSTFARLKHELQAEEQIGQDLKRRIDTLEAAICRERVQYEGRLKGCGGAGGGDRLVFDAVAGGDAATFVGVGPLALQESKPLTMYLERLPKVRERSCRELLTVRLQEAGINIGCLLRTEGHGPDVSADDSLPASEGGGAAEDGGTSTLDEPEDRPGRPPCPEGPSATLAASPQRGAAGLGLAEAEGPGPLPLPGRRWTLRSHLDGARCVVCDEQGGVLVSCGEDALVKGWDLSLFWRGPPHADELEPFVTLRGHTAPVLALAYHPRDRLLFSAGMDHCIRAWRLPESQNYSPYGANSSALQGAMRAGLLAGHGDSVWSLQQHQHLPYLASASADGSVGLWSVDTSDGRGGSEQPGFLEASFTLRWPGAATAGDDAAVMRDVPACAVWVPTDVTKLLAGYVSSRVAVLDTRRGAQVAELLPPGPGRPAVTSACCHNSMQLAAVGHVDNCARLVDLQSGRFVGTLADHTDVVTSVSMDSTRAYCLVTGSHDGYVRSFDIRTGKCCESLRLHRPKYDEAVHCVHLTPRTLATAGADGDVVAMLQLES